MSQNVNDSAESKQQADRILGKLSQYLNVDPLSLNEKGSCRFQLNDKYVSYAWIDDKLPRLDFMIIVGKLSEGPAREDLLLQMMSENMGSEESQGASLGLNQKSGDIALNNFMPLDISNEDIEEVIENLAMQAEGWNGTISRAESSVVTDDLSSRINNIRV